MSFGKQMSKVRELREILDPADYTFCCEYYCGPNPDICDAYNHQIWPEDCMVSELGVCDHCGTDHFYGAIYKDKEGNYLRVGNNCASKFFEFKSRKSYLITQAERAAAARARAAEAQAKAQAFLAENPDLFEIFKNNQHHIIQDIKAKLFKYGSISEKQVEFVYKLDSEKKEEEVRHPIPTDLNNGRHEFVGTVKGFKTVESDYGVTTKMVFQDDRGFFLYGTAPSVGEWYDKGARLSFCAKLTISDKDETFGFYSRPTKAKVIDAIEDNQTDQE